MEFSLLGAALLGVSAMVGTIWWQRRSSPGLEGLVDIGLSAAVTGLIVGRITAMVIGGTNPFSHPGDLIIVRGGVNTVGATVAAFAAAAALGRRDLWGHLDALAPASLAGLAAWHGSCLVRGSCLGDPSGLPWAFGEDGIGRHPVEIYAALLLVAASIALYLWWRRRPPPGVPAGAAVAAAAAARLVTEPLRPTIGGGLEPWYAAGLALGVAWAAGRWVVRSRGRSRTGP